ncbi:MAG: DUF4097 family beta strand repeat protein [Candidatus Aminicenantes bacterium]|nr:DUF4097 family beta strand repeat protein [Candidatus Aminicenantes bacterium]
MTRSKILIILSVFVLLLAGSAAALADYREDFSKTLPLKAGERFSLDNVNGGVTVSTWKEDKVEIKAVKTARDNEKDLKDVEIRVDQSAGTVSVKAIWPKNRRHFNVNVDFEIKVPEGVILDEVETVNGGVEVTGRYGRASVGTTNGSVRVEDATGELKAYTTNGGIQVKRFEGRLDAETTNGNIRLEELKFKDGISAETTNGSITLAIASPDTLNANLLARTTSGNITVDFPVTLKNLTQSKHRVEAKIGQGGPEIALETTNGSIKITK